MNVFKLIGQLEPKDWVVVASALIAAVTSFASLFASLYGASLAESRKSQRDLLAPIATELGELLHELLATSRVFMKRVLTGETANDWQQKAVYAADRLEIYGARQSTRSGEPITR